MTKPPARSASPSCCPATMRRRRSRRPWRASAPRCPTRAIYVYDNNSTDRTREVAAAAGAIVRSERMQGKGHVVRRMFADVEADIYVMADGDATYDAAAAPALVAQAARRAARHGRRRPPVGGRGEAYRRGHVLGNRLFTGLLASLFGRSFSDIFSGYRVFSRRFAKCFPALSRGFETETEISVHALELAMPVGRGRDRLWRPPRRLAFQALHLARRLADPEDHPPPLPDRAAGPVLRQLRLVPGGAGRGPRHPARHHLSSRPAWCPASRPRSSPPA